MIAHFPVRLATPADAAQIAAMSRDYIEHGLPWGWTTGRVARAIRTPNTNVAVIEEQGKVLAFGIMSYKEEDAHLQLLAVAPEKRRSGLGSVILLWLEEVARTAGIARIRLEARQDNGAARCFYNEHGYHELAIRPKMYSGTTDGVVLQKWLRQEAQA